MGKGDIKSRRGKLFAGSYGKRRPRKKVKTNKASSKKKSSVKLDEPIEKQVTPKMTGALQDSSQPGKKQAEMREKTSSSKATDVPKTVKSEAPKKEETPQSTTKISKQESNSEEPDQGEKKEE